MQLFWSATWVDLSIWKDKHFLILPKGPFKNYVDKILTIFDYLPTSTWTFFTLNVDKKKHFLTTYPPHLVHVVFERPPMSFHEFFQESFSIFRIFEFPAFECVPLSKLAKLLHAHAQLNKYETTPHYIQLTQNLTSDCWLL